MNYMVYVEEFVELITEDMLLQFSESHDLQISRGDMELAKDPDNWDFEEEVSSNELKFNCNPFDNDLKCYVFIKNNQVSDISLDRY